MKRSLVLLACIGWAISACSSSEKNPTPQEPAATLIPTDSVISGPSVQPARLTCAPAPSGWREMASYKAVGDIDPIFADWVAQPVWTGTEALYLADVEKGINCSTAECVERTDAAAFNPVTNTWRTLPPPFPSRRAENGMFTAWTGSEWLIFGGWRESTDRYDGRYYTPGSNTWSTITTPPISPAIGYSTIWIPTTHEMLVWGGLACDAPNPGQGGAAPEKPKNCRAVDTGAAYSMVTHTWRKIASSPLSARYNSLPMWDGQRVIVVYGIQYIENRDSIWSLPGAAAYDPTTDTWELLANPPVKDRLVTINHTVTDPRSGAMFAAFFGGHESFKSGYATHLDDGAMWDPAAKKWEAIHDSGLFPNRTRNQFAHWSGNGMLFVWGGEGAANNPAGFERFNDGGFFSVSTRTWTPIPAGGLSPRSGATALWTGCEALVYGGWALTRPENNKGAIYRP